MVTITNQHIYVRLFSLPSRVASKKLLCMLANTDSFPWQESVVLAYC